ncbi:MAG: hypothetical protein DRN30_03615 [Thermoplasmata archaeon]|nr:hypothetical protein [Euryarchaeota archaeon]RLF65639.1 MAG: hypothetical protein DRN30_03615 [Thermoplasmata archaeon]
MPIEETRRVSSSVITVAIIIGVIAAIVLLMSMRILPVPTTVQIISWLISLSSMFFLAVIGGIFAGMYIYHTFSYSEKLDPWEKAVINTEKLVIELKDKIEKLEREINELKELIESLHKR